MRSAGSSDCCSLFLFLLPPPVVHPPILRSSFSFSLAVQRIDSSTPLPPREQSLRPGTSERAGRRHGGGCVPAARTGVGLSPARSRIAVFGSAEVSTLPGSSTSPVRVRRPERNVPFLACVRRISVHDPYFRRLFPLFPFPGSSDGTPTDRAGPGDSARSAAAGTEDGAAELWGARNGVTVGVFSPPGLGFGGGGLGGFRSATD